LAALLGFATAFAGFEAVARAQEREKVDPRTGDHVVDRWHKTMGTVVHITVWGDDDEKIVAAIDDAFDEFDRLDKLMTIWTADSEISRVNAAAGTKQAVPLSDEIFFVLQKSIEASKMSGGAFDVTVGAFFGVWKFDEDKDGTIPTKERIEEKRKLVGWKDIILDTKKKTARLKRKGQAITLGGIAKGYAVDRAVKILRDHGLVDFIVQGGGDMYVSGRRGDRKWRVGIRDPRGAKDVFFAVAEIEDMTFSTSGDYERYVIRDGVRYHHILDPKTGTPAMLCRSVTVMAKDGITAEGVSKAVFVLGPEKGMALVEKMKDVEVVIVDAKNQVHVSKGLDGKLKILTPPTDGI
jgi:thiamine biosynthesis lipoprotein